MAEQKIEDTKTPVARRGARPFAGPAGAPSAARPLLRPAAPGARSTHAPFVPPAATRQALGTETSAPRPSVPVAPALPVVAPVIAAATFDAPPDARTDEIPLVAASVEAVSSEPSRRPVTSEMVALDAFDAFEAVWNGPDGITTPDLPAQAASPLDELSLGSGDAPHPWAEDITANPDPSASPPVPDLGASQMTAGFDRATPDIAMPAWLNEEIAAPSTPPVAESPRDAVLELPTETAETASVSPASETSEGLDIDWGDAPSIPSADDVMASEPSAVEALGEAFALPTEADEPIVAVPVVAEASPVASWPDPLLAEYAPYLAVPDQVPSSMIDDAFSSPMAAMAEMAEAESIVEDVGPIVAATSAVASTFEILDEPATTSEVQAIATPPSDVRSESGLRVSAALGRLAERVRDGEIDVSSVSPEATDAAVLASVLAALLGGSSSR